MKKAVSKIFAILTMVTLVFLSGCLRDAIPDDGSGYPAEEIVTGGGSGSSGGWSLCKNTSYDIFDLQVWGDGAGTFDYENKKDCGRFTMLTVGGGWVGGGLIAADTTKTFDFTGVSKMKFDIRGNINPKALCIAVQNNGGEKAIMYPSRTSLVSSAKISALSEREWNSVEFDVSGAAKDVIINAFCIFADGNLGGSFKPNEYFEIRNLDWVDSTGNSVKINLK